MTTFTDKELIKEIKERIGSLDVRDNIERRAYEIALVSLEAEPVAWLHSDNGLGIPAITRSKNIADSWLSKGWYVQPLYIAKPVPMVPDVRPSLNNGIVGFDEGWNACRAAMLHGAEPVSQTYKLNELSGNSLVTPDGWISCSERMPDDKQYVWCWGKSYGWTECDTFEGYYDWSRNKWWAVTDDGEEPASKVTHWMPLPEPPQEVK
ncbi:DUF551 domain-containing protein [Escherichia coli]|uniref:DUF551 domain-containing protein n=1 Tax=Escherichia coli O121 TaxID=1055537 RepID=A0AAP9MMU0_ECOLX|nr:DUF551 domain-containing protein [Escherichia coli O121:H19]AWJ30068.1 DUF551 domain-containing protein [Escherichia coli O121 str. RM8352]EEC9374409.1 DUF551 domain-containing protein [Escherichia coli]EFW8097968.1 DUF551 domain-containing protein [Shigella sonnei]EHY1701943.1 DUF551 domain-containing protein [Escherichia coli O21]EII09935.1 PF04448 family protein [Escherichia coli 5.0959]EKH5908287.1 DUF551 domain-containing protein [Escherichia coli O121]ETI81023.1 hypothetical protein